MIRKKRRYILVRYKTLLTKRRVEQLVEEKFREIMETSTDHKAHVRFYDVADSFVVVRCLNVHRGKLLEAISQIRVVGLQLETLSVSGSLQKMREWTTK